MEKGKENHQTLETDCILVMKKKKIGRCGH